VRRGYDRTTAKRLVQEEEERQGVEPTPEAPSDELVDQVIDEIERTSSEAELETAGQSIMARLRGAEFTREQRDRIADIAFEHSQTFTKPLTPAGRRRGLDPEHLGEIQRALVGKTLPPSIMGHELRPIGPFPIPAGVAEFIENQRSTGDERPKPRKR
jgi:hypothetical protein